MKLFFLRLGNLLFKYFYIAYRPLYFFYKEISDRDKIKLLKRDVKSDMVVLDIGANIGFYTILFSKLVGKNGRVYAFEPDIENFNRLKNNTKKLSNVILLNKAVGSETKNVKLYKSNSLNVDHQTYDSGENRFYTEVQCISIDDYLKIKRVDFVKIDIQGYDYYAVKGMSNILNKLKKVSMMGEFWPYGLNKAGVNPEKYFKLLKDLGFSITVFGESCLIDKINCNIDNKLFYFDFYGIKQ
ncbi:FkbM family methyltransferase [Candidatus Parcubacteria bacterium]|nr:FkbM family methyltransferase [Candidatus Parcubacteria bacterium]